MTALQCPSVLRGEPGEELGLCFWGGGRRDSCPRGARWVPWALAAVGSAVRSQPPSLARPSLPPPRARQKRSGKRQPAGDRELRQGLEGHTRGVSPAAPGESIALRTQNRPTTGASLLPSLPRWFWGAGRSLWPSGGTSPRCARPEALACRSVQTAAPGRCSELLASRERS